MRLTSTGGDLSVQATIAGKTVDHLEELLPLAYNDLLPAIPAEKTSH